LKYLRNEKNTLISSKDNIKRIVELIKKSPKILELFNKWKLNSKQEKILVELWCNYNLK
jgi:hypothetical protein